jgi:hypothetical protein
MSPEGIGMGVPSSSLMVRWPAPGAEENVDAGDAVVNGSGPRLGLPG